MLPFKDRTNLHPPLPLLQKHPAFTQHQPETPPDNKRCSIAASENKQRHVEQSIRALTWLREQGLRRQDPQELGELFRLTQRSRVKADRMDLTGEGENNGGDGLLSRRQRRKLTINL